MPQLEVEGKTWQKSSRQRVPAGGGWAAAQAHQAGGHREAQIAQARRRHADPCKYLPLQHHNLKEQLLLLLKNIGEGVLLHRQV